MPIDHGAKVRTRDGHQAGHVKHAIWDPSGKRITEYVITTGGLLGHDVIVSPELLESAARDGNAIVLSITNRELDELAHYESGDYTTPPAGWLAPTIYGFPTGGYLWPVARAPRDVAPEEQEPSTVEGHSPKVGNNF
ncbi:MAG: hypothetical protein E6J35_00555 [Chloroflexi bacterium]|nr:MAG: hypothetical protein E6J35_00555 [Chloroflexota bacterium]TME88054.1 MAG: hypothetical protein E6I44_07570 [Chloroflexota bacterium]